LALAEELIRLDSAAEFERSMAETAIKTTLDMAVKATVDQIRESLEENKTETKKVESERIEEAFRQIAFKITAPEAREIYLVGDFNQWKLNDDARLSKLENGSWEKRLDLKSGRYKYKFVIDGQWVTDSQNGEKEVNSFGTFDSIIKI
jgi:1,4-alpha-glucan branching enzyme